MRVPRQFGLALVCRSHGWYDLAPWRWDGAREPCRDLAGRLEVTADWLEPGAPPAW